MNDYQEIIDGLRPPNCGVCGTPRTGWKAYATKSFHNLRSGQKPLGTAPGHNFNQPDFWLKADRW